MVERLARTPAELAALGYDWRLWARKDQLSPPGDWRTWVILAGRGWGKTRTGAEWVHEQVANGAGRIALIGRTVPDVRDVMVEGESGILATAPPWARPKWQKSLRRLTWDNGAIATTYTADEPDLLRGPQHDRGWADELCAWRYPDAWDQFQFGLRLRDRHGRSPRAVVTTTPRPTPLLRTLLRDAGTVSTRGSTFDNAANLAADFLLKIREKYEGTRLGRQELFAEILDDTPGALWKRAQLDELRVKRTDLPRFTYIVVAIDPATTDDPESDETGIVVAGLGVDRHAYILEDLSGRYSPATWARIAVEAYHLWGANIVVAETNQGGQLVTANLKTARIERDGVLLSAPTIKTIHAKQGKRVRAEPVSSLYEQRRVHHVGVLPALEDQMCTWDAQPGSKSPDRVDADVYAVTQLLVTGGVAGGGGGVPHQRLTGL